MEDFDLGQLDPDDPLLAFKPIDSPSDPPIDPPIPLDLFDTPSEGSVERDRWETFSVAPSTTSTRNFIEENKRKVKLASLRSKAKTSTDLRALSGELSRVSADLTLSRAPTKATLELKEVSLVREIAKLTKELASVRLQLAKFR